MKSSRGDGSMSSNRRSATFPGGSAKGVVGDTYGSSEMFNRTTPDSRGRIVDSLHIWQPFLSI